MSNTQSPAVEGSPAVELFEVGATMEQIARIKDPRVTAPEEALNSLREGNARFFSGEPKFIAMAANARRAQIMAQTPFAVVLGCADSRVPVEIVFDQGPGDIFSIRVAGNVAEDATLGSIQYAVLHLKVQAIVVMGHEGCGAVAAAMLDESDRAQEPDHVQFLLNKVVPAVRDLPHIHDKKARMREAVIANVRLQKAEVTKDPTVAAAIASGQIQVVGAFYEIGSGAVDFLED